MTTGIPAYGLKAYAVLFARHGTREAFRQAELDWMVSSSMKKKIFALLVRAGWIQKRPNSTYVCTNPSDAIRDLLAFRVPEVIKKTERDYAFTRVSAVEIWSDFAYVQRDREQSPYVIKVLRKDVRYWKQFFNSHDIPNYVGEGATIGEYVVLIPVSRFSFEEKNGFKVDAVGEAMQYAKANEMWAYAAEYMKNKYGEAA